MDEDFSLDLLYWDECVHDELYQLVQHHLCSQLDTRLRQLPHSIQYLRVLSKNAQEQMSLLMAAALNGYDDIVRILLTHDNSSYQVELKGQVTISNGIHFDDATALYCACYGGHFTVAKTLIELGKASVNADTIDYQHYPLLIHATIMNRGDIVRFLLKNKYADVNGTKSSDCGECTALIWAAFRGHTSLVEYLIGYGADVNYSCHNENLRALTPLDCATIAGHLDSFRLLYNAGADPNITNQHGHTLLQNAMKDNHHSIVDFLLEQSINTVEDLELAACSLIKVSTRIEQMRDMLQFLRLALQRREQLCMPKVCIGPIAVYDYQQECQTVDQLDGIQDNRERMFLETLLIRERIFLSRADIRIIKPLHDYGDMLVQKGAFDQCLDVWIHMFYLYQQIEMETILHRFVWLFCRMLTANQTIPVERFLQVCRLIFEPSQMKSKDLTLLNALFLVIIVTKILEQDEISAIDRTSIYCWVKDVCRSRLTDANGRTLLHICVDNTSSGLLCFRRHDTFHHLKFPNESALRLLLACGSRWLDLDAVESVTGNTPLHLICRGSENRQIIQILLNSGCHMDSVDTYGRIPVDYIKNTRTKSLLISKRTPSNLKCLCARFIAKQQLNTDALGTSPLHRFLVLHGCHPKKVL